MSTEFIHDWSVLYSNLDRVVDEEEREKYRVRLMTMFPKYLDVMDARLTSMVTGAAHAVATPAVQAVAPKAPLKDDYSYDEFAELFEKYDRNVADSLRVWFKDIEGGFDASSPADRSSIYGAATEYLERKSKATSAPSNTQSSGSRPYVKQGGGGNRKSGPCPDCDQSRRVTTKYGERWRCDEHNYWGAA